MTPALAHPELKLLFSPLRIGAITLANRFVMPAMQRGFCRDGAPAPELAGYYRKRAEGGVSMIIGESCAVDHPSATKQPTAARLNTRTSDSWARCVEDVRNAGSHMLLQLWHEGALRNDDDGMTLSASGLAHPDRKQGRAATADELMEIRDAFAEAAVLAKEIGASGVEIHAAHGYMLDQFLWAKTNLRDDGFGGPLLVDRLRLPAQIISAIKSACGPAFLVSFRFSQWKEHDYGARIAETPEELAQMTGILREAGVDLIHVSTRRFWTAEWPHSARTLADWTRQFSGLPIITVGSVGLDRDVMESFTTEGEAQSTVTRSLTDLERRLEAEEFDLVAVGRSLIADADWVRKVEVGDYAAIRPFQKQDIAALAWK